MTSGKSSEANRGHAGHIEAADAVPGEGPHGADRLIVAHQLIAADRLNEFAKRRKPGLAIAFE
jgi:hypothetical protein